MKNIEDAMIPVSVVKAYLENVLAEWDALGDRKYELPNMQVYNHIRKELDDLEAWILQNCRAKDDESTPNCRVEFYNTKNGSTHMVEMYVAPPKGPILCVDDRVDAYDKLVKIVGEEAASEYIIKSAHWF